MNYIILALDFLISGISMSLAYLFRFDFVIPSEYKPVLFKWILIFSFIQVVIFFILKVHLRILRYTSLFDLFAILKAIFLTVCISSFIVLIVMGSESYPRSTILLYGLLNFLFISSLRLSVRIFFSHFSIDQKTEKNKEKINKKSILLIGAGKTGEKIAREILSTYNHVYSLVGFADDDKNKIGGMIHGVKVLCSINNIPNLTLEYDEVIITLRSATTDQIRKIVDVCKKTKKKYKTIPNYLELLDRDISITEVRDISYVDLLGREEIKLNIDLIKNTILGKRILVTGAGGSIGAELVKQAINYKPKEIICLDNSEEKIFNLSRKYEKNYPVKIRSVLADINNKNALEKVFIDNIPAIVFHAAAYKHVPIQELHPWAAVNTNIGGTYNLVKLSDKYFVENFILVSTDKAVNPVNIMGATKRTAEKIIQSYNQKSKTNFMAVRFGNVLGSSGSAIPIFQEQIRSGGPITITHPEMTRYFMSIQEASQLILQCCCLGKNREIFLLKMGNPVKILQMAKDLIKLSGLEPEIDIPVVFTGLRPGEKLYEELQFNDEKIVNTENEKILILKQSEQDFDTFYQTITDLLNASINIDSDRIQNLLRELIPSYQPRKFKNILNDKENSRTKIVEQK
jgi:FlaA1/EpsC-like NDP-sugar epimerase